MIGSTVQGRSAVHEIASSHRAVDTEPAGWRAGRPGEASLREIAAMRAGLWWVQLRSYAGTLMSSEPAT
jgi:hypothetical protein